MKPAHIALAVIAVGASIAAAVFAGLYFTTDSESEPVVAEQCGDRTSGTSRLSAGAATSTT